MSYSPDYSHMLKVLSNHRPTRLPLYEHSISPLIMEKILNIQFADLLNGDDLGLKKFFNCYCRFFKEMTYDTVSFEVGICDVLPDHGAILGGKAGPIQNRADFEKYPWDEVPQLFWERAEKQYTTLGQSLPAGMKAIGGVGYGVFEISEDMVGFEHLCYLQADDPELFADLYRKIGDLMCTIWTRFLQRYKYDFVVCRMGDDLGFKNGTLLAPDTIRQHILPQYRRIIDLIHQYGKPFLLHSCGNIFEVMDDIIACGINAKHSNEDIIAPFDAWIERYIEKIGLLGGIDVDILCQKSPEEIFEQVVELGQRFRRKARGYALGSGNSIPDYVPAEGYLAMIRAARHIREFEKTSLEKNN